MGQAFVARFTYGDKWTPARMETTLVCLPVDASVQHHASGAPDWAYMESVMKGLPFSAAIDTAESSPTGCEA